LPLLVTLSGLILSYFDYRYNLYKILIIKKTFYFKIIYNFFFKKWYFDRFYNELINQNVLINSYTLFYKFIDRGVVENFGPSGIVNVTINTVNKISVLQTGFVNDYIINIIFLIYLIIMFFFNKELFLIAFFCILLGYFDKYFKRRI
jgi:NADH-quinone oxidoreductase subunit L